MYIKPIAMKTKAVAAKPDNKKEPIGKNMLRKPEELKTDSPLSEKDEVKQAEERLNKPLKKHL